MNPNVTPVVLGIDPTDRDPTLVDSHAEQTHPATALQSDDQHPTGLIAHLDEKQHALAFEMRDVVSPGANSC